MHPFPYSDVFRERFDDLMAHHISMGSSMKRMLFELNSLNMEGHVLVLKQKNYWNLFNTNIGFHLQGMPEDHYLTIRGVTTFDMFKERLIEVLRHTTHAHHFTFDFEEKRIPLNQASLDFISSEESVLFQEQPFEAQLAFRVLLEQQLLTALPQFSEKPFIKGSSLKPRI